MRFATGVGQRKNIRNPPEIAPYSNESEDLRFEYLKQTHFFLCLTLATKRIQTFYTDKTTKLDLINLLHLHKQKKRTVCFLCPIRTTNLLNSESMLYTRADVSYESGDTCSRSYP